MRRLTRLRPGPERSRLAARDLVDEAVAGLLARPGRAVLTILGTVLGVGALVATLGIAQTAGNQIVGRFNALAATHIVVEPVRDGPGGAVHSSIPWDVEDRLHRLNGVAAAGTLTHIDVGGALTRSIPLRDPMGRSEHPVPVLAASWGLLDAVQATVDTGRWFDAGHDQRGDRVAVLGPAAAQRLGITRVDQQPAVFVDDETFVVIGLLDDAANAPQLLDAITIPNGTARARYDLAAPAAAHVATDMGAAQLIARQAPVALDPNRPERLYVQAPTDPSAVREAVTTDVNAMFLILGGVSLLVGAIGIANVTLVSVLERVGEIGLRRALGGARRHVAAQFLAESAILGVAGGVLGASAGVLVVVGVAAARTWTPVLAPWVPLAAPGLGAAVGLVAGLYPALRAAGLEPVDALRAGGT
jgi:putative ABC transport system permease protein